MLSFEILAVVYWPIISYLHLETTFPPSILGVQPLSQFFCFQHDQQVKELSLIFPHALELFRVDSSVQLSAKNKLFGQFLSVLIDLYHEFHLNLCHLTNLPWIWINTVCLHNLWRKITCQVMLLPFMPAKEFFPLNIYFIFQEALKSRSYSFGIVTVIFWYLVIIPPRTHYCECFSFSTLLSYKSLHPACILLKYGAYWSCFSVSDPRQILWPGVIRFSLIYKNEAVQF